MGSSLGGMVPRELPEIWHTARTGLLLCRVSPQVGSLGGICGVRARGAEKSVKGPASSASWKHRAKPVPRKSRRN